MKHLESEHRTGKDDKTFITDEDLARLPDVIFNPDKIVNGGIRRGAQRALFEKSFDEYHTVVAEVIQRGDQISVVTYKKDPLNKVSLSLATDHLDAELPQGNANGKPLQRFSPTNTIPNSTPVVKPTTVRKTVVKAVNATYQANRASKK